jgi:hypothetical protein
MRKRPSLKGKGADIFAPSDAAPVETSTPRVPALASHSAGRMVEQSTSEPVKPLTDKATFYLPSDLLDRLDRIWMERRRTDRRIRKSDIVKEALEAHLK